MRYNRRNTRSLRRILLERDPRCAYCSCDLTIETATIDHRVPLSRGGSHEESNLTLACQPCNNSKDDATTEEFFE